MSLIPIWAALLLLRLGGALTSIPAKLAPNCPWQ